MLSRPARCPLGWLAALCILFLVASPLPAAVILYEHLPEANSNFESHHQAGGPVLADDFDSAIAGSVVFAEWWGTAATSPSWELTLHWGTINPITNEGEPAVNPASTGGIKYFVTSVGTDVDGDGIYYFSTTLPGDFAVLQGPVPLGLEYWFSIANFDAGWNWALAGMGPTVGDEHWNAVRSTGALCGDGGPHCGPWVELPGNDFAFRLSTPEPAAWALVGAGLIALGLIRRKAA